MWLQMVVKNEVLVLKTLVFWCYHKRKSFPVIIRLFMCVSLAQSRSRMGWWVLFYIFLWFSSSIHSGHIYTICLKWMLYILSYWFFLSSKIWCSAVGKSSFLVSGVGYFWYINMYYCSACLAHSWMFQYVWHLWCFFLFK